MNKLWLVGHIFSLKLWYDKVESSLEYIDIIVMEKTL